MIGPDEKQPVLLTDAEPSEVHSLEAEYDPGNGTRYHGWAVRLQDGRILIAVEPTIHGRSWYVFNDVGFLASTYTQEKLYIGDGDLWALHRFVCWLTGRDGDEAEKGERPHD